jgi:UDP-glucose:(heptosyl)LPS alpha-1,3-glucosyltransferase
VKIALVKKDCGLQRPGGMEKVYGRLLKAFIEEGHDVTPIESQAKSWLRFRELREFDKDVLQRVKNFDLVLSFDRTSYQTHHRAGNGVHAAYLDLRKKYESRLWGLTFSFNPLHRTILDLEKKTFEDPHLRALIVNSHLVKSQVLQFYNTPENKIHVIHNGVEWSEMKEAFEAKVCSQNRFLFVGHNFHRKGLKLVLKAMRHLPDAHLTIVGHDKKLAYYQYLARDLPVTFVGPQKNLLPFYQQADTLILPSLYDPFANVTLEALAMGLFVITSNTNGGHEVLTKDSGITLPQPITVEALVSAMSHKAKNPTLIRNSIAHLDFPHQLETLKTTLLCT